MSDADLTLKIITSMRDEARAFHADMVEFRGEMVEFRSKMVEFRSEMLEFRAQTGERLERLEAQGEITNSRLSILEHTISGHTQQLASVARIVNNTVTRREVADLRARVEKLESE